MKLEPYAPAHIFGILPNRHLAHTPAFFLSMPYSCSIVSTFFLSMPILFFIVSNKNPDEFFLPSFSLRKAKQSNRKVVSSYSTFPSSYISISSRSLAQGIKNPHPQQNLTYRVIEPAAFPRLSSHVPHHSRRSAATDLLVAPKPM